MNRDFKELLKMLSKKTPAGSDYTGTVTRVKGNTAYVQFTGSQITDTPVSLTVDAKAGDKVRIRVSGGKAWLTGPPSNDKEKVQAVKNENTRLAKRIKAVEDGVEMKGVVHFKDLESDEETTINGGKIDAVSLAIKEYYAMYNGDEVQRILAFDKSNPFPGVESFMVVIDPDENISACYINTGTTWVKAFTAATEEGASLSFDSELFYLDMPVYGADYEPTGNTMRVLSATPLYDGSHVNLASMAVYNRTAGGSANVGVNQYGTIYRVSSSSRYKHDIRDLSLGEAKKLLDLKPRTFKYNDDFLEPDDERRGMEVPGFISEEVEEVLPIAVDHDEEGNCEMWNSNVLVPCLLKLVQHQEERIRVLEEEMKALKGD